MFFAVSESTGTVGDEMLGAAALMAVITVVMVIVIAVWSIRAPDSAPSAKPIGMFLGLLVSIVFMLFVGGVLFQDIKKPVDKLPGGSEQIEPFGDP